MKQNKLEQLKKASEDIAFKIFWKVKEHKNYKKAVSDVIDIAFKSGQEQVVLEERKRIVEIKEMLDFDRSVFGIEKIYEFIESLTNKEKE
mgnify:CR=1 FL=1